MKELTFKKFPGSGPVNLGDWWFGDGKLEKLVTKELEKQTRLLFEGIGGSVSFCDNAFRDGKFVVSVELTINQGKFADRTIEARVDLHKLLDFKFQLNPRTVSDENRRKLAKELRRLANKIDQGGNL